MKIYIPMTVDILTAGHIKFLQAIKNRYKHPFIVVGLLRDNDYKRCVVPYEDREYILRNLKQVNEVYPQEDIDPYDNLIRTGAAAIASGDGWEKEEREAIKKWAAYHRDNGRGLKPKVLNIKLKGEKGQKLYSSTKIKEEINKNHAV